MVVQQQQMAHQQTADSFKDSMTKIALQLDIVYTVILLFAVNHLIGGTLYRK